ncbi:TetR/AcrR family transcriptional regulator [Actinokineospora bangkokensis]|uniref:TetR family transcriptional regulator n=1 Tax=Actinokineospora bangkokensis TaxID=1193682 RepID=A0A1Q9LNG4_9PSEU|nr:TetR family transcriptional regulator [Actinokineospora bangkokensis]OLR93582.1 TetR family transcriptional regulator [Actinokineospora bangkokensis]
MTSFKRARSEEQRAKRRQAILDTAAAMVEQVPVADVTLNELSRRVCLAKSNVLRYFESREAILLELLDAGTREWVEAIGPGLRAVDVEASPDARVDLVAQVLAGSLAERPVLCDLFGNQAAVLERNVSTEVAITYKRTTIANLGALADLVTTALPELAPEPAREFSAALLLMAGGLWAHSRPTPAMLAAYEAHPELQVMRVEFAATARRAFEVMLSGFLARQP